MQHSVVENSNPMGVASAGDQEGDGGDGGEGRVEMEPGMTEDMSRLHIRLAVVVCCCCSLATA